MNSLSTPHLKATNWMALVLVALMFWFSSSLLLDLVIMPGLFVSGMMSQPGFGSAGYGLFWIFNRLELVCAALILTGLLAHRQRYTVEGIVVSGLRSRWAMEVALGLLAIGLVFTYLLTPAMGALGVDLNPFASRFALPVGMDQLHALYFALEGLKLLGCGLLLKFYVQDLNLVRS